MQKINKRQGLMLCAAGLLVIVMLTVFVRFGTRHILVKWAHMDNFVTQTILFDNEALRRIKITDKNKVSEVSKKEIDWVSLYPFPDNGRVKNFKFVTVDKILAEIRKKAESIKKKIEAWTKTNLIGYSILKEFGNSYEVKIRWNLVEPMPLGDGSWSFVSGKADIHEKCESIADLARFVESNGAYFLYIQAPRKVDPYGDTAINGVFDFTNYNVDNALVQLSEQGVETFDLRQEMHRWAKEDNVNWHSFFFRTDHHWKPETALRAAKIVGHKIDEYGIEVDDSHYDLKNFELEVLHDWFLGSEGRYATLSRVAPDDFSILHPKFETQVHFELPELEIDDVGSFEITYDKKAVAQRGFYNCSAYHMYGHSDRAVVNIENLLMPISNKKVLLIRDSFCDTMGPFLALGVRNVMLLDIRHFTGSVRGYIEMHKPEVVVLMYSGAPAGKINWSSHKDAFDFR